MKIPSKVKIILFCFAALLCGNLSAQYNPPVISLEGVKNTVVTFHIYSSDSLPTANLIADHGVITISPTSEEDKWQLDYDPDENFVGTDEFVVEWYQSVNILPFSNIDIPMESVIEIEIYSSMISAEEDVVTITSADPIEIYPLDNDISTAGEVSLTGLSHVMYGTAEVTDSNTVIYMPSNAAVFPDYIVYSVSDAEGSQATSRIYLVEEDNNAPLSDTLYYSVVNTSRQIILLPFSGFSISNGANLGNIVEVGDQGFVYVPNEGVQGEDVFTLSKDAYTRHYEIEVLDNTEPMGVANDDHFYTAQETTISFDVFANDFINGNVYLDDYSDELIHDTLGVFSYTPPAGFEGFKEFFYSFDTGLNGTFEAKIYISIGNYEPVNTVSYDLSTPKNKQLVLNYIVPIEGYNFNLLQDASHGFVQTYGPQTTTSLECDDDVSGQAYIIYTPYENFVGTDGFEVEYCIEDEQCSSIVVNLEVYDYTQDSLCHCVNDCVWSGDTNGDGRISVSDVLPIGYYIGQSGSERDDIDYGQWEAQEAEDWTAYQQNGKNTKHIDSDGDGLVTVADTAAISEFYQNVHNFVPEEVLTIKDYPFYLIPQSTDVDSGDLVIIDIAIGDETFPVVDLHGMAFGLDIPPGLIDSASTQLVFFEDDWFADNSPSIQMTKVPADGRVESVFTRTGGIGISGSGIVAQLSFIVEDDLEGFRIIGDEVDVKIQLNGAEGMDENGKKIKLPSASTKVKLHLNKDEEPQPDEDKLLVFPNPTDDLINLHFNGGNIIKEVYLYDVMGKMLYSNDNVNSQSLRIRGADYNNGIYILNAVTSNGVVTKKVKIQHDE